MIPRTTSGQAGERRQRRRSGRRRLLLPGGLGPILRCHAHPEVEAQVQPLHRRRLQAPIQGSVLSWK